MQHSITKEQYRRGSAAWSCAFAGGAVVLAAALTGFRPKAGIPMMWVALWALCWYGGLKFLNEAEGRFKAHFATVGGLFAFAAALGWRLDAAGVTGWGGLAMAVAFALCAAPAFGQGFGWLLRRLESVSAPEEGASSRKVFWVGFGLLLLGWTPVLLAFYPGIHAYDSFSQIPWEWMKRRFGTHHPILHTVMCGSLYELGGMLGSYSFGLLLYSLLQMAILAAVIAYALMRLYEWRCPRVVRRTLLGVFCLAPQYAVHAIGCTKDIPFAAFIVLWGVELCRAFRDPKLMKSPRFIAGFVAAGTFMCLFRNNGLHAVLLTLPFALLMMKKKSRLRLLALILAVLLIYSGASEGLTRITHASSGLINEMLCVPAQQLARIYVLHIDEDPRMVEIPECVPWAKNYQAWDADFTKLHLVVQTPQKLWKFIKLWVREFFHYPTDYLDAFLYTCKGYWHLEDVSFTDAREIYYMTFYEEQLGVTPVSYFPQLKALYEFLFQQNHYRAIPVVATVAQPAFYLWMACFALAGALYRRRREIQCPAVLFLMYLFTQMLGPLVAIRYMFYLMIGAPLLVGLLYTKPPRDA